MRIAVVLPRGSVFCPRQANSMETVVRTLSEGSRFRRTLTIICEEGAEPSGPFHVLRTPAGLNRADRNDAVAEILKSLDPDVIEYHQQLKAAADLARRFPGKAHVLHRHTRIKPPGNFIEAFRYGRRLKRFNRLIFVSQAACAEFSGDYPALADRVVGIGNPIDIEAWRADPQRREKLILFSGRAMPEKGLDLFCEALATVLDRAPDWRGALMLGDWEKHSAWAEPHVRSLDRFGDRVEIRTSAPLPDVIAATRRTAVAVTPSRVREALGLTALEAHAAGAALISSGRGGLREASGPHALYIDPLDADSLAEAMLHLVNDPAGRVALARAAQAYVAEIHSPAARSVELDDLREALVAGRAHAAGATRAKALDPRDEAGRDRKPKPPSLRGRPARA